MRQGIDWSGRTAVQRLGVLATVAVLAGCGSSAGVLDTRELQRDAAATILREHGIHVRVSCPADVPRRAGFRFWCTALLDVGSYPLLVAETNGDGRLRYENNAPLQTLDIERVRRAIADRLAAAGLHGATVLCPAAVIQQAGVRFGCRAEAAGQDLRFSVRELDDSGRVRYGPAS